MATAPRDNNMVVTLIGVSSADGTSPVTIYVDPVTHRVLTQPITDVETLAVGTTGITGGANGQILYDNNGVLGELATTGSGNVVLATSPTLITPTLGVATATTINKVTFTAPATGSTLTIADGKTLTVSNILTFTGTDSSSVAFGAGGTVVYTGVTTLSSLVSIGTITTGTWNATVIGPAYGGTGIANNVANTITFSGNFGLTLTLSGATSLTLPTSGTVTAQGNTVTGSGSIVLATSPTLVTPTLGVATATTINKITITTPATGSTITIADGKTLTVNNILTLAGTDSTTMTFPSTSQTVAGLTATQTFTNKRNTRRVGSTASSATPTINTDNVDIYEITALAAAITSFTTNLSGTPNDGDLLQIAITDNGTARAITWGASFEASGNTALPTTTVISTRLDVLFCWNVATSKWRCLSWT